MERYSEVHPSKWQSKYSEEFKRFICNEYLNGSSTRREIVAKYKIGNSRLTYWFIVWVLESSKGVKSNESILPIAF
jgi:transposase-like protein